MNGSSPKTASLAESHKTFVYRLIAGILFLNLLVLALSVFSLYRSRVLYEERVRIHTSNLAQSLSQTIAGCIEKCRIVLFSVKTEAQRQIKSGGLDPVSINAYLQAQRRNIPELQGLRIIDARGYVRYGDRVVPEAQVSLSDRQHFITARSNPKGGLIVTEPLYSRVTKNWVIDLVLPLENPDGSFAGSALGAISLDYFKSLFSSLDIGKHGVLTLRDAAHAIVVRYPAPHGQDSPGSKIISRELETLLQAGKLSGTYTNSGSVDQIARTFSYRVIAPYPLLVSAGLASRDYLQPWYHEVLQMAVFMVLFASGSLVSGWHIYRNRREQELNEAALIRYRDSLEEAVRERTAALRESEEQFRTLCDFAPIGIFRSNLAGDALYLNPHWAKLTGRTVQEGLAQGWLNSIHPDDRQLLHETWAATLQSGQTYSLEHRQVTREGNCIWVHALASPIKDTDGTTIGYVGSVEDITERRLARLEHLKNQKLESLGILAGGIAHDFNNILTAMLGNISLAQLQLDRPELALKRLQDAEKAAGRAGDLTKQLLTFAKGGQPVKEIVALPGLLRESAQFALHGSKVKCDFVIADDLRCVEADQGQLSQVIHNLVLNAVQAMPEGGTITLRAENRDPEKGAAEAVVISVADTGVGIPASFLTKVFDPYFTTKHQGSGLGLATCYSIVKKHGGTLTVASTPDEGSEFTVTLPAAREGSTAPALSTLQKVRGTGAVLVMDDEEEVRTVAKGILEEFGYRVDCVENGSDALARFLECLTEGKPYAAVILDLTIPGGTGGKEIVGELKKLDPAVKVIVSSGYSNDPILANPRDYGFAAVLSKPYQTHNVAAALRECQV